MLPDNTKLQAMIDAATPGIWNGPAHHGTWEVEAEPNQRIADCGTIGHAKADASIMAKAKELAAEVIRLRERLATVEGERNEARAEVERLRELVSPTTPSDDNEEPARITASWRVESDWLQLLADDTGEEIGSCWRRAPKEWTADTHKGVTVHGDRGDAVAVVEKWAKNCGFLVVGGAS